jgi:transcriptional repressor NrdR
MERLLVTIEHAVNLRAKVARLQNGHAGRRVIPSSVIGEIVIGVLKKVDPVAYLRFASVYKSFENVQEFRRELKTFKK